MNDLTTRALAAYFRSGGTEQPSTTDSGVETTADGKQYVALRNVSGILAVYRVKVDGVLKRLKRYPSDIR